MPVSGFVGRKLELLHESVRNFNELIEFFTSFINPFLLMPVKNLGKRFNDMINPKLFFRHRYLIIKYIILKLDLD